MKIKSIKLIKSDIPIKFYDITVDDYHNFSISNTNIIVHNSSIIGAINKLARPFGNAIQILNGYGFFGSEVSPSPASPRYTSVKLSPTANGILNKYNHLTTKESEGPYDDLWMDIPLGLTSPIVGIAVGYKTTVLPRRLKDIQEFLEGKRKNLKPYFEGFSGTVEKYKGIDKSWFISSTFEIDNKRIMIHEIPPILKYTTVIKKLDFLFNKFEGNIRIINNSNTKVNIDIVYTGKSKEEWEEIISFIKRIFSIIVTENPVFIKDGQVLVYDSVEQYLEDYKWQVIRLKYKNTEYEFNELTFDLKFNEAKFKFITWILQKQRTDEEVTIWLKPYKQDICEKLERLTSRKFTTDELFATTSTIRRLKNELKFKTKELNDFSKAFLSLIDPTLTRSIGSKKNLVNLFEIQDIQDVDGVTIWQGDDVYEEIEKEETDEDE